MKQLFALCLAVLLTGCAALRPPLEAPHVTLTDLRLLDMTLFEQRYGVKIRVQNPNPIELPITGTNFRLDVNDNELGRGVSNQKVTVPAYGEAVMEIQLTSNLARIIDQLRSVESGKGTSLHYRLVGWVSLANRTGKLPFDYRGEIGQRR